jgi:hypothetical protein
MDQDFVDNLIGKPIAEIPQEQLDRIQRWLIIVFKKIDYGLIEGLKNIGYDPSVLTKTQLEILTSSIWNAVFKVPIFEILGKEEIAEQLLSQKIRPMTCDDIFKSSENKYMDM